MSSLARTWGSVRGSLAGRGLALHCTIGQTGLTSSLGHVIRGVGELSKHTRRGGWFGWVVVVFQEEGRGGRGGASSAWQHHSEDRPTSSLGNVSMGTEQCAVVGGGRGG